MQLRQPPVFHVFFCFCCIALLATGQASAESSPKDVTRLPSDALLRGGIEPILWYLESPDDRLTLDEVRDIYASGGFSMAPEGFNGGFTESDFWFAFKLRPDSLLVSTESYRDIYLEIEYPHIDKLLIYQESITSTSAPEPIVLGDRLKFSKRPVSAHEFIVPVRVPTGHTTTFWIRVESTNLMQMPIKIWHKDRFLQAYGEINLINGMFFGLVLIMALYNLFIGIMIRDKTFFLYFCYFAAFGLFVFSYFGFGFQYLWPEHPALNDYSLLLLAFVMQGFGLLFSRSFLDTREKHPRMNRVLWAAVFFCISMLPLCFIFPYRTMITVAITSGLIVAVLVNLAGIFSLVQGRKQARFYVVGWSSVMVGWVVFNLAQKDVLPLNFFTLHAVQFGAILEVLFLSLALGDQINKANEEKNNVRNRAKAALEEKNRELRVMLDRVRESSQLKDEFLATISHELRTPMNGVEGALGMLEDIVDREKGDEPLRTARNSAHLMTQILESLLEFSELQSGKFEVVSAPFVVDEVIGNAVRESGEVARRKGIDFQTSINLSERRYLISDGGRIEHVLFQLVDNAVKFTHEGSIRVDVTGDQEENTHFLIIRIADTGVGIEPEKQSIIFEKFRQVDGSFSRQYGGLGIGLTLAKALVSKLQGVLELESAPGKGTVVTVKLPVTLGDKLPAAREAHPIATGSVLIVEDNPVNQMTLKALVTKLGYSVTTANNGQEAIDIADVQPFDCILMDCQMPVVDGFEATEALRQGGGPNTATPIVAVTANAMSADKQRCLQVGMNDYIKKPATRSVVSEKLSYWVHHSAG